MPLTQVNPPGIHTNESALDWTGIYAGTLPCAKCPGIRARLVLNEDRTYFYEWSYIDAPEVHHQLMGNVEWDPEINTITLEGVDSSVLPAIYSVGPNAITQHIAENLPDLENLASHFVLEKQQTGLLETKWVLVELSGNAIPGNLNLSSKPFIQMIGQDNRLTGNGSCNNFFATFTLGENNQINISGIGSTKMMCEQMSVEKEFFEALERINSYYILADTLVLIRDAMIQSARFKASGGTE
jgi:copper homeostasis protein (lipoprotein)